MVQVETPELGVPAVYVRSVRAAEFNDMRAGMIKNGKVKEDETMARLVTLTTCDAKGNRIFEADDWQRVNDLPLAPVMRLFRAAMKLNNLSDDDVAEIAKNSPTTPSLNSG